MRGKNTVYIEREYISTYLCLRIDKPTAQETPPTNLTCIPCILKLRVCERVRSKTRPQRQCELVGRGFRQLYVASKQNAMCTNSIVNINNTEKTYLKRETHISQGSVVTLPKPNKLGKRRN